jgi:hypothetical protein
VVTSGRAIRPAAGDAGRVPYFKCRRTWAERLAHGIPLAPNTLAQVRGAARAVGLADAEITVASFRQKQHAGASGRDPTEAPEALTGGGS